MSGPFGPRDGAPEPPEERRPPQEPEKPRERLKRPEPPKKGVGGFGPNTTWIVGVVAVLFIVYITYNTITTDAPGSRGVTEGSRLPPFVAPLALANLKCKTADGDIKDCDANVQTSPRKGIPQACAAHRDGAMNSCDMVKNGPVVLAFLVAPSQRCIDQIDLVDRVAPRFPDVQFAAVAIRGDRDDVRRLVRRHGWKLPVAYDHDGAVSNAYAIAVCPTITFARRGGKVAHTTLGDAGSAEVVRNIESIRR
jgi:hypothetical protein